ncbi:MAG: glycosyltransferase family 2 protein [Anaerolineae bacterium]|nr:glycosyltransferase family 2 protein [Anaerolineae bacterium]
MAEMTSEKIPPSPVAGDIQAAPVIWILVLNWNRPQDTLECVASLRNLNYPAFRILVVDNGSTDESVDLFRTLPGIDLVVNEQNLGFAAGNNRGIQYALERGADWILLLNNDTTVSPPLLSRMIDAAQTDPQIGMVGPVIYYSDRPDQVWFAGMRFRHGLYVVRRGLHLKPPLNPVEDVDFISGCGMLVPRQTWERVGLFDPRFFMYYEDLDFCVRAKMAGYRLVCATQAHMWHALSASTGGPDSPLKQYYQVRSTLLFSQKHTRGWRRTATVTIRLGHAGFIALRQALRGQLRWEAIRLYVKGIAESVLGNSHRRQ